MKNLIHKSIIILLIGITPYLTLGQNPAAGELKFQKAFGIAETADLRKSMAYFENFLKMEYVQLNLESVTFK